MKNVLSFKKFSLKAVLMGFIVLFATFYLMPKNLTYASLTDDSNLAQSLDNIEDLENFDSTDPENPGKSNDTNHKGQEYCDKDFDSELN